jgi:CHAT domain-containing protein
VRTARTTAGLITALTLFTLGALCGQTPAQLRSEANELFDNNKFEQANIRYKAAQAGYLAQSNWADYLRCQGDIAQCLIFTSQYKACGDTLRRGLQLYDAKLSRDPSTAEVMLLLKFHTGILLARTGKFSEGYNLFEEILPQAVAKCPNAFSLHGRIHRGLGYCKMNLAEYPQAEQHCLDAIRILGPDGQHDRIAATYSYLTLGNIREYMFNFQGALECYQLLERWQSRNPKRNSLIDAFIYGSLGRAFQGLGDYTKALEYSQQSLSTFKQTFGLRNLNTIGGIMRVADIYRVRQQWNTAMPEYVTALQYLDSLYQAPNENRAMCLSTMAECQAGLGQWPQAVASWQKAITEAEHLDQQRYLPLVRESLGKFYLKNGNLEEALTQLQAAEQLLEPQKGNRFADLCRVKALVSKTYIREGRYDEALAKIQESLQLQCRTEQVLTGYANPPEDKLLLSGSLILTLATKADALYYHWTANGGDMNLLRSALQTCHYAIQAGERFRQQFQRSRDENYEWVGQYQGLFVRGVAAAQQLFQQTNDRAYLQQAFALADRNKALLLSEGLQNADAKLFAGVPRALLDEEAALAREIAYYERKVAEATTTRKPAAVAQLEAVIFEKKRTYEALIAGMERDHPYYFEQKYRPRLASALNIQQELDESALFIEYLMDVENRQVYIFTISKSRGLDLVVQPLPDGADAQLTNFNALLKSVYLPRDDKRQQFIQLSHRLYRTYLQPVAEQLRDKKKIIVVADGQLHYLPFELLLTEPGDGSYNALPYLLRQAEISYQYSGSLWIRQRDQRGSRPETGLLAFAPVFNGTNTPNATQRGSNSLEEGGGVRIFPPLPNVKTEVKSIVGLFVNQQNTVLMDQDAHETALKAALEQPFRIIHLASHSFANTEQPKFSGIACSSVPGLADDNILYAGELYNLRIQADLVVLSSCESGAGKLFNGTEGLLGLNRSFIYAGAANIVYSLWGANDQTSNDFMVSFYEEMLKDGQDYATALRAAKLRMLDKPATASPGIWGGFLLLGQ